MKKLYLWMFAAVLTICGAMTFVSCTSDTVDNPSQPTKSAERAQFEKQLSTTLENAVKYQNLQPTLHAAEVMTGFIEHLNVEALSPQLGKILSDLLVGVTPVTPERLSEKDFADARAALSNTFPDASPNQFFHVEAGKVLNHIRMTFIEGEKEMVYEKAEGDGMVVAYKNPTTKEDIEVKFDFDGAGGGTALFITRLAKTIPVAVQIPPSVKFTIRRTLAGQSNDVMYGVVTLTSPENKKYISIKNCEWQLGVATDAANADRYEVPMAIMHHYADGKVDGEIGLLINDVAVLSATVHSTGIPYSDAEMESLKVLREKGPVFAAFYELLSVFNSRSGKAQLIVMEDLEFNIEVTDIAKAALAIGNARQYKGQQPAKDVIDPLTDDLNNALSFTVKQRSTNITAEGLLMTAEINGRYKPALALRFEGEKSFQVMNANLSEKDRANYESLMKSFDAPGLQLQKLFDAFAKKREEFKKISNL